MRGAVSKTDIDGAIEEDVIHMVSAFLAERSVVLAQLCSAAKHNENEAARELLSLIDVVGSNVQLRERARLSSSGSEFDILRPQVFAPEPEARTLRVDEAGVAKDQLREGRCIKHDGLHGAQCARDDAVRGLGYPRGWR